MASPWNAAVQRRFTSAKHPPSHSRFGVAGQLRRKQSDSLPRLQRGLTVALQSTNASRPKYLNPFNLNPFTENMN